MFSIFNGFCQEREFIKKDYHFNLLGTKNGLSSDEVVEIKQDTNGYTWIATLNGLNRYNGTDIKVYMHDKEDSTSILNNSVASIFFDNNHTLWIGYENAKGMSMYNENLDRFQHFYPTTENTDGIYVRTMMQYDSGALMLNSIDNGSLIFNTSTYNTRPFPADTLRDIGVVESVNDELSNIWLATASSGVIKYSRETGNVEFFNNETTGLKINNWVQRINCGPDNVIYATSGDKLVIIDQNRGTVKIEEGAMLHPENKDTYLAGSEIDIHGDYWYTVPGATRIENNKRYFIRHDPFDPNSLVTDVLRVIYSDPRGNYWFGSWNRGLCYMNPASNQNVFNNYYSIPGKASISGNVIDAVSVDNRGRIWACMNQQGVSVIDRENNSFTHFNRDGQGDKAIHSNMNRSVFQDQEGKMYIVSLKEGVTIMEPSGKGKLHLPIINPSKPDDQILARNTTMYKDSLFFLADDDECVYFNMQSYEVGTLSDLGFNAKWDYGLLLTTVDTDNRNKLYFAGASFFIADFDKKTIKEYNHNIATDKGARFIKVFTVYKSPYESVVWLGTQSGLYRFDEASETFHNYSEADGLPSNTVKSIITDNNGALWLGTNNGIAKGEYDTTITNQYGYTVPKLQFRNFGIADGLPGKQFLSNSVTKTPDGELCFGSTEGLTVFHPEKLHLNERPPEIQFTDFKLFNKSVPLSKKRRISPLSKHINKTREIILQHNENVLTIDYVAINYISSEKNQYAYFMEGFEENWNFVGDQSTATYTNLSPGDYVFQLKAANNDGIWTPSPRTLKITVLPPWWQTWWFYTISGLLIIFLVYSYIRWREKQARQDKITLQRKIDEGQKLIDSKVKEVEEQKEEIMQRDNAEKIMKWHNRGLAHFGDIISKHREDFKKLCEVFISELVDFLEAGQGAIFILVEHDESTKHLEFYGGKFVDLDALKDGKIQIGEGIIGTAFQEQQIILEDDLPENFSKVKSGLGETSLNYLVACPVILDNHNEGVIEILSFNKLEDYKIEFIQKICNTLASVCTNWRANQKIQEYLEVSKMQQEEMTAQEEELRQNMEEMQAQQEDNERKENELRTQIQQLEKKLKEKE
jgi:ligand-binding sensor domain-containing protein/putative methionine-R-sulfoxide reductase with GAF domain